MPRRNDYYIEGRERLEWDAPALAQLIIDMAKARVAERQEESSDTEAA